MYNNKIIAKRVACYNQHAAFSAKSLERMVLAMTIFEELGITYEEKRRSVLSEHFNGNREYECGKIWTSLDGVYERKCTGQI